MNTLLRHGLLGFLLLCGLGNALAAPQMLKLHGRSDVSDYSVGLDEADWSWLRGKGTLVLGSSAPDYSPFSITSNRHDYEGITADYAQLMEQLLHVKVRVQRYASRNGVLAALKAGDVDMLGSSNGFEAADPQLQLSDAYAEDQPTLVSRVGDSQNLDPELAGKRVAMLYHYLPPKAVEDFYPKASLQLYPSTLSAIGAVAFGQADVYLGDAISANYLINRNYLNNVQLADFSRMEVSNFSFSVKRDNTRLLRIINASLAAIPVTERQTILRRWSAGGASMPGQHPLHFSVSEQRWLDKNPRLRVAIDEDFLPMSFYSAEGEFRGISADVLAKVALRTGLKFDIQRVSSVREMIDAITSNKADLLITITPSEEREAVLRFTRPYLATPFVLVTRTAPSSPNTLDDMHGKRLAVISGDSSRDMLTEQYPDIRLVDADSAHDAMEKVANGEADAAVNSLITARYMISRQYRDRLRITSTVGVTNSRMAFATARGSLELFSILDKALLSIAPEEMDELTNRWRSEVVVGDSYWLRNRSAIIQGFGIAAVLLVTALGWIAYLRMLMRKRKQAEQALSDQVEFMRVLINGTPHPIYVRDRQGKLLICNSGYLEVFQVEREQVIGKTVLDGVLGDPDEAAAYHRDYLQVMESGEAQLQDRSLIMPDGRVLTIYHWMLPYRSSTGEVSGMIAGWIDISERQRLLEDVHAANRAKTTFLATMSHEIRTPMNAVIGMLELATKKADQGVMDRFAIDVASGAARGLLDLIGDILDIARIESGRLSLNPERANLRELLESVVRIFEGLARQKQLQLQLDLDAGVNRDVLIDPLRFKQIVSNLLSNAIKFTAQGHVRLSVRTEAGKEQLGVRLQVEDSGMGIGEEDQKRLFSPFTQASNNDQSARSGSGLGLVISRTLCEMMGGRLTLDSTLGQGTRIDVRLDLTTLEPLADNALVEDEPTVMSHALNILVIDDYPANRQLLTQQLNYLGHRVEDAEDGAHGLRAWRNGQFDVVITDCNMPLMNGYELARAIRADEAARGLPPSLILGFTANAQPEEKGRCLAAGMDDCLFKPISLKDLSARLAGLATEPGSEHPGFAADDDIDLTSVEHLAGGNIASIKSLLGDLAASNEQDMARLMQLFTRHDLQGLADIAHRVKGGARIIKARVLIRCCEDLEAATRQADSMRLTETVDALHQQMEQLGERLERYLA
ncbi:MAG: transporter substrate-binding domain-containing protein [Pseudomonas sp.]|jgi:two-component system sensor histidine kinase EvgS|uniref:transporter substrate-binding domain-containing protein n=1 Tax=Pseudomonas sp. TaxID=306 RepID=UPI002383A0D6|nr:transporter substrate-binding domain-containing protein [Pseudomonas sp.]MDP9218406.1 transporter substrate-binding domain-containing protein [Pseudomonadota bacterium]MDE1907818.1 transporter substrate-binding domain-containing protein [Pseudomonas sp.]MDE2189516.1 transporter substrate-binding domain-containing protein [Pseudomonas sp.]MDE2558365.1 transporter substrate-binding domain-containing protein [Pseudomonas sp.]MDQ3595599.1 transporter substrate-binding domain-containing protein 